MFKGWGSQPFFKYSLICVLKGVGMTMGHLPDILVNASYHHYYEHVWLRGRDLNHFQDIH